MYNATLQLALFDWQVTTSAVGVKGTQRGSYCSLSRKGLHHAAGGEHKQSRQAH